MKEIESQAENKAREAIIYLFKQMTDCNNPEVITDALLTQLWIAGYKIVPHSQNSV